MHVWVCVKQSRFVRKWTPTRARWWRATAYCACERSAFSPRLEKDQCRSMCRHWLCSTSNAFEFVAKVECQIKTHLLFLIIVLCAFRILPLQSSVPSFYSLLVFVSCSCRPVCLFSIIIWPAFHATQSSSQVSQNERNKSCNCISHLCYSRIKCANYSDVNFGHRKLSTYQSACCVLL